MKNVKKLMAMITAFAILVSIGIPSSTVYAASGDTVVYITKTGECYHSSGCSSLRRSKIETTLQSAIDRGYRACSKCNPGSLDASSQATSTKSTAVAATTTKAAVDPALEALKTYKGNNDEFNAYAYYINNADLQTAIGADGDKLLKHFNDFGKAEGRKAK
jgi:hypothetical protein